MENLVKQILNLLPRTQRRSWSQDWILKLISLPVLILTLGLFTLVINTAMLGLTALLLEALTIDGFWSAFLGALVITVVSWGLNWLVPNE